MYCLYFASYNKNRQHTSEYHHMQFECEIKSVKLPAYGKLL